MRKWILAAVLALPLTVAGVLYAKTALTADGPEPANANGYVCPITGEELPCPKCCPLNQHASDRAACY